MKVGLHNPVLNASLKASWKFLDVWFHHIGANISKVRGFQVQRILNLEGRSSCLKESPDLKNCFDQASYEGKLSFPWFLIVLNRIGFFGCHLCLTRGKTINYLTLVSVLSSRSRTGKKNPNLAPTTSHLKDENEITDALVTEMTTAKPFLNC